jgi:hypothetical protein
MVPGRREWDVQVLRSCLLPHDVAEVQQIQLLGRVEEDTIVWYYERTGIFTVKSAYRLALQADHENTWRDGSSRMPGCQRSLYKQVWSADVPPKVRVFAWRHAQEGLAMQENRKMRKLCKAATCQICGIKDETGFHAVVRCTKFVALKQEMRSVRLLSGEEQFWHSGSNWLVLLLSSVSKDMGARILLLFWRAWHLRNDLVHGDGLMAKAPLLDLARSWRATGSR